MSEVPKAFLDHFVKKGFRERFLHEWKKKPGRLNTRICHSAHEIFGKRFKYGHGEFDYESAFLGDSEMVLVLNSAWTEEAKFSEVKSILDTGNGILIISKDGKKFIAETESIHGLPYETYAGES